MAARDDVLKVHCLICTNENTLRFEDALHNRTLTCTLCGQPIHWRSCPACGTGWVAQQPGEACHKCSADPAGHFPALPAPAALRGRRSPWHRACPMCGARIVPLAALVGSRCLCPHCRRFLEDTSSFAAWWVRLLLGFLLSLTLGYGLSDLLGTVLGVKGAGSRSP